MKSFLKEWQAVILLSFFGFSMSGLLAIIPLVGVFLALAAQLLVGGGLGYCLLSTLSAVMIALATLLGFFIGFTQGATLGEHESWRYAALLIATFLLLIGFRLGARKAGREDERDSSLS